MISFIKRLWYFFFSSPKFEELIRRKHDSRSHQGLIDNYYELRGHVFRAGKLVFWTFLVCILICLVFIFFDIRLPHLVLIAMRIMGYCLMLWGILSHVGRRTWGGKTLPEIFDEEWYKFSYLGGLSFLLLSYFLEIHT